MHGLHKIVTHINTARDTVGVIVQFVLSTRCTGTATLVAAGPDTLVCAGGTAQLQRQGGGVLRWVGFKISATFYNYHHYNYPD